MTDIFPSFFEGRKSPMPAAASAASAARELREDDLQRMQQVQQQAMAEIGYGGLPRAADAASAAGRERGNQTCPKAATVLAAVAPMPPPLSPPPRTAHRAQPVALALAWQTRAASLEQDAGLPREWAEPLARLLCAAPPLGFEPHRWAHVVEGASIFADQWAAQAFVLGWPAEEIFGLDEIEPAARHDRKGVVWLLTDGKRVVALDAGGADIETARGVKQRFYRINEIIFDTIKGRTR
jgi:hypothetical protein